MLEQRRKNYSCYLEIKKFDVVFVQETKIGLVEDDVNEMLWDFKRILMVV